MGINKNKTVKMIFNGYNYKAEWKIDNFLSFIGNEYKSPVFSSDNFQVQLSLKDSLSRDNEALEITFNFVSIPNNGLSLNYSLNIDNKDSNKVEKLTGDEVLSNSKKEFIIFSKTKSKEITAENGFLEDGSLHITCFFRTNSTADEDLYSIMSYQKEKTNREIVAESNWIIKEEISEFHSTEEPLQISINDKTLSFAFTFEITEKLNYALSLIIIDPEFSFNGEVDITLINYKDESKNIKKTKKLRFDRIQYEQDPIFYEELNQETLMNPENGWIKFNTDTKEIESGIHFKIQFINLKKEQESKESVFSRLSLMNVYSEKMLRENVPITIQPERSNHYCFNVIFPDILNKNINEPIISPEYHTGSLCERYIVDFSSKSFIIDVTDYPQNGGFMSSTVTFLNQDNSRNRVIKFSFLFCTSQLIQSKELPITYQDISDPEKGWLFDGSLKIKTEFDSKNSSRSFLYPVKSSASSNDLFGFKFLIPISLFDPNKEMKIIDFPAVLSKNLNITPFIHYSYTESDSKIQIQTNFDIILPKNEYVIDFMFTYENMNQNNNFVATFTNVETDHIQMPLFTPEKSLEEDGFVFEGEESKKVLHLYLRIHYQENNIYNTNDIGISSYKPESYEEKKAQNESKLPAMLPEQTLNPNQNPNNYKLNPKGDYYETYVNYNDENITGPHDFASKKDTGYVGLKNQGATCYMNSLLQSLFHLPAFRRLVYEMPTTGSEDPETNIPLNLQRLFSQMQFSDCSCSTVNLTKSFGWGSAETFQQHDIEEFLRVLIDNLENKMKGSDLKDSIPHLFRGTYRNYIKCKNVDYQSNREENFYDLSMDVKGIPNLVESFKNYVKKEELTGDNQYKADSYGLQDAIMGVEFVQFPPVLHLHLRRFMFDYTNNGMYKINDQFEFPQSIDLSPYLADDSPDRNKSNLYDLYGVLVHQGGVFEGHYYAFLRTSTSPQWYKFNDSFVSKDTAEHAIDDNFGYSPERDPHNKPNPPEKKAESIAADDFADDEENDQNETELDEIVNDNERDFVRTNFAEMGIDICCGRREIEDISIHGSRRGFGDSDDDNDEWKRHLRDVFHNDQFERMRKMKNRNKNKHHHHDLDWERQKPRNEKSYSGYMLVYVRREDADSIFEPVSDESVPEHLKNYVKNLVKERKSSAKDKPTCKVQCAHESVLRTNSSQNVFGFFPPPEHDIPEKKKAEKKEQEKDQKEETESTEDTPINISTDSFNQTVEKSASTAELYATIASKIGLDPSKIRLWRCSLNLPVRIIPNSEKANVAAACEGNNFMTLFIQPLKEEEQEQLDIGNKYMIYTKFFFSEDVLKLQDEADVQANFKKQLKSPIQYLFSTTVNPDSKVETLVPLVNEKLGFPKDTKLDVYQETLNKTVAKLTLDTVFRKTSIGSGSILIFEMNKESIEKLANDKKPLKIKYDFEFQIDNQQKESEQNQQLESLKLFKQNDLDNDRNPHKSIQNYFQGEKTITLEIYDYLKQAQPLFLIQFSREIKISEAKRFLIKAANEVDKTDINLDEFDLSSILLFRRKGNEINLIDIDQLYANQLLRFHFNDEVPKGYQYHQLFYYITPFKGRKACEYMNYAIQFSSDSKTIDSAKSIYILKNSKCGEIFTVFKSFFDEEEEKLLNHQTVEMFNPNNRFRFLLIEGQIIERVFDNEKVIVPYDTKKVVRIEVIPPSQLNTDSSKLLRCFYSLDFWYGKSAFSQPFLMDVVKGELFLDTKKRLKQRFMDLPPSDQLEAYKFYLMVENVDSFAKYNDARRARKSKLEGDIDGVDGDYSISKARNTDDINYVQLDDFAMLSEFAEDNTFNLQLVIILSKSDDFNVDAAIAASMEEQQNKGKENAKKETDDRRKDEHRIHHSPPKSRPSHNDVKIYN